MRGSIRDKIRPGARPIGGRFRPASRAVLAMAGLGIALGVTGCANPVSHLVMDQPRSVTVEDSHPIDVTRSIPTLRLKVSRRMHGLSHKQKAKIHRFLYEFKERGAGKIRVSRPRGAPNQLMAGSAVAQIKQIIDRMGVPREKVILSVYRPTNRRVNAPVVLTFVRYHAEASPCGDWSRNLAVTYKNRNYPNFGCFAQANLAAMVANPRDLVKPRTMTPPDAIRRDTTLEHYRKGEVSAAQKSDDEKSEVSDVAK